MLYSHIVKGSYNTISFNEFIQGLLGQMQIFPALNSVIVMDNCQIHKAPEIRQMIKERFVTISYSDGFY
jgi:hypothetical protein